MAKLIADMSMSLDGYIADEKDGIAEVFAWLNAEENAEMIEESVAGVGAILTGRRTSDLANEWNGQHPAGVPTYVVSHRSAPDYLDPEASTVHFVDAEAVRRAKETAGEKDVGVAGGDTVRQLLSLGLLDEIRVSLAPVLLGRGIPYFPDLVDVPVELEGPQVTPGNGVTRLRYPVKR
jgi:dihydrofolate reductase